MSDKMRVRLRWPGLVTNCARRTPTIDIIDPSELAMSSNRNDAHAGLIAPVERGPSDSLYLSLGEWPRLPFTARNILTHPTPSAPRRALVPGEHSFTVRVLRARRATGRSLPILLRPRVARAQKIIRLHPISPTPLPKYSLWVYHEPVHQGTLI